MFLINCVVACTAFATLALELLQTRVLSALYHNNIVYLTVTVALLGFGISGVIVSICSRRIKSPEKYACVCIGFFALSSVVSLRFVSFLPALLTGYSTLLTLIVSYFILVIPFVFSGCALGIIFMVYGARIYKLYCIDMVASGLAAISFALLLAPLGAVALIWLIAIVVLVCFLIYGYRLKIERKFYVVLPVFLVCMFAWGEGLLSYIPVWNKGGGFFLKDGAKVERTMWSTIAKIDVWNNDRWPDNNKQITQDNCAATLLPSVEYQKNNFLNQKDKKSPLWFHSFPYLFATSPDNVMIIGPGGGTEIAIARAFNAKKITGVEINPAICKLVTGPYRNFLKWPNWSNVTLENQEGRHFVRCTKEKYDIISMTGVDTFAALSSGAYVLSENYLYTVDAIQDYLNALSDDGTILMVRMLFPESPRETLRLANLYLYAADRMMINNPSQSIMVLGFYFAPYAWAAMMIKKQPFTQEQIETILNRIGSDRIYSVVYLPDVYPHDIQIEKEKQLYNGNLGSLDKACGPFNDLIRSGTLEKRKNFEASYRHNITPVFDDRPFFFEYHKVAEIFHKDEIKEFYNRGTIVHYVLFILLGLCAIVCFLSMIVPLYFFEREGIRVPKVWHMLAFFCCLGFGFMFIEIGLIQKLSLYLGHPMYTLVVTLAGLLAFTGLGSMYAGQIKLERRILLSRGMLAITFMAIICSALINWVLAPYTLHFPIGIRILLCLMCIFPLGIVMGIPFATGLRYLEGLYPRFIPWAWGINGITSVLGSILAIIVAMRIGFNAVVLIGAIFYLIGLFAILKHLATDTKRKI